MKWITPQYTDKRLKSWFAWFPVRCPGETKWLERVTVVQRYFNGADYNHWGNLRFATPEDLELS